jgi:hypothetical protein
MTLYQGLVFKTIISYLTSHILHLTFHIPHPTSHIPETTSLYSYRIASIGSRPAAFLAGYQPKNTPVNVQTANDKTIE